MRKSMNNSSFRLALVIPVYNEEENVMRIYESTKNVMEEIEKEAITVNWVFADNASDDKTVEEISKIQSIDNRIQKFTWVRNYGVTSSVLSAMQASDADVSIVIDADGQEPTIMIKKLFNEWINGFDFCYGIRVKRNETKLISFYRKVFRKIAKLVGGNGSGKVESGCWLFDKAVVNDLLKNPPSTEYLAGCISQRGYRAIGLDYSRGARRFGNSKFDLKKYFNYALGGLLGDNLRLLRFSFSIAILNVFISLLVLSSIFVAIIFFERSVPLGIFSLGLMINGLGVSVLVGVGILGEYVGRIFKSTSRIEIAVERVI
jgi:glycosyltransferase involved in cell wall biosynthesis